MNRAVRCLILLICLMISLCGCNKTECDFVVNTTKVSPDITTSKVFESGVDTQAPTHDMVTSTLFENESITSEPFSANLQSEDKIDFNLLTQIFSMSQSEYTVRKKEFTEIVVEYYGAFPESVTCHDFVISESDVKFSAGMSYNDITNQLSQFSKIKNVNFTIYNVGPHEYTFYENGKDLRTAIEYFLCCNDDSIEKIYRFCFLFNEKNELLYIKVFYPSFKGTDSMLNRSYFQEYSDICFKHIDDLTVDDISLLLNTKRSYIYSLYHFSSLELRSRIMDTFYYSSVGASPIVNTTIAYGSLIEGEKWMAHLEEYPLFISIDKGRFLEADISSDFPTVRNQWGEPLYEGIYEDILRDEIVYNYMTYVFDDIMVVCVGSESNKEDNIIISHCLVLPRDNELFTFDGVYKSSL